MQLEHELGRLLSFTKITKCGGVFRFHVMFDLQCKTTALSVRPTETRSNISFLRRRGAARNAPQDWALRRFGRAVGLWDSQEALRARARRRAQGSWVSESKMSGVPRWRNGRKEGERGRRGEGRGWRGGNQHVRSFFLFRRPGSPVPLGAQAGDLLWRGGPIFVMVSVGVIHGWMESCEMYMLNMAQSLYDVYCT